MYRFKLKENSKFEVGDVKVKDGTKSTVTDINPVTGAISWDVKRVGAFDTVYKTFDKLNKLLRTLESEGEAESDPTIDSITDQVKKLFNQYRTHVRKNYPEAYDRIRMVKESEQWTQLDVNNVKRPLNLTLKTLNNLINNIGRLEAELSKHQNKPQGNILYSMTPEEFDYSNLKSKLVKLSKAFNSIFGSALEEELSIGGKKVKTINKNDSNNPEDYTVEYEDGTSEPYLNTLEESVNENKFYVTRNLGRGQGKGLVKKFDDKTFQTLDEPRTFDSYKEAETFVKRRMSGGASPGQMTAYWVSDENMNRIENVDEGEGIGYMTPNAFSKDKKSNNTYKYKLGSPFNKPVPKKIKGSGLEVKQLFEKEELTEYSDFQQKRINIFDDVEEKINSISPLLSNAKNETSQYYNETPGSYAIVYSTAMVNELLDDIIKLLKQGE